MATGGPIRFQIDDLVIDATPEVDVDADVETTDHPIEEGADSTDHAREKPITLTATCIVSNIPVDPTDRERRDATDSNGAKAFATGGYSQQVYERISRMKADRQLHTVVCVRGTFKQMLITKISTPVRAEWGDGLMFKIAFKSIRIVTSGTAQFIKQPATRKPTDKDKQAKKQGKTTDPDADKTWAATLDDSTFKFTTPGP